MDEVFIIADKDCPRCSGKDPADLFAVEVTGLHNHLAPKGVTMWMWGDRLIDGPAMGIHKWEASHNGTAPAIDRVAKDIVICDWHYDNSPATPEMFASKGFRVLSCPWRTPSVALEHVKRQEAIRATERPGYAENALGILQTVWSGRDEFINSCLGVEPQGEQSKGAESGLKAAEALKAASVAMRRLRE